MRTARERAHLTREELSTHLGFNDRQTVSTIESGSRRLKADELLGVIEHTGQSFEFFTDEFRLAGAGAFNFREKGDGLTEERVRLFEDIAGGWIATYRRLAQGQSEGPLPQHLAFRLELSQGDSYEDAWAAAESLTEAWDLHPAPAEQMHRACKQNLGLLCLYVNLPSWDVSGAACKMDGLNTILINRSECLGRRNFDFAHELFHLLTWDRMPPPLIDRERTPRSGINKRVEELADNFAAAFLMPESILREKWEAQKTTRRLTSRIKEIALYFRVTEQPVKFRLLNLGIITKEQAASVNDHNFGSLYAKEPLPKRFSKEFVHRLHNALDQGHLSVRKASKLLHINTDSLAELFREYDMTVPFAEFEEA